MGVIRSHSIGTLLLCVLVAVAPASDRRRLLRSPAAAAAGVLDALRDEQAGEVVGVSHAVVHGLFWLLADLAATRPLLLVVDDAQWADDASNQVLIALRSLAQRAVLIVLATRGFGVGEAPADARVIDATGMTVYPGLIDANANIGLGATAPPVTQGGRGGGGAAARGGVRPRGTHGRDHHAGRANRE